MTFSVVVPVFNEERRIARTFAAMEKFLATSGVEKIEIIFVDDGSGDKTVSLIQKFNPGCEIKVISYAPNRGKGFAVRQGMLAAGGDYALVFDADMSTSMDEFPKFLRLISNGASVIIGTRKAGGAQIKKYQPWYRRKMGETYTALANFILGMEISDFTCGFKCFSRQARERIFKAAWVDRWSYDAEILFLAKRYGFRVIEIPVSWENDEDTKVRLGKDTFESFKDLIRIRFREYPDQ